MSSQDPITEDEIVGTTQPASPSASSSKPRNAFSEIMAPKRPAPGSPLPSKSKRGFNGRDSLGQYILSPKKYPSSVVIYHDDSFVAINDRYPKSSVHCLLLPRSKKHTLLHPFEAFEDAAFLASVRAEAAKLKTLVAKELQRKYGTFSKQDEAREAVLNGTVDADELPVGRDWEREVRVGVHAHPSMNHLHVHVISVDRSSVCLKHRKHYNSFSTPFFVDLADFSLKEDDARRHPTREGYLSRDMKCWRCERNFGNKFASLKEHLEMEFEEWKRE